MTVSAATTHNSAQTRLVEAAGVNFAYRKFGPPAGLPVVLLQHFRGNLDNWDPAFTPALAAEREVILVDYPRVGSSTREPSGNIAETARQMIAFVGALGLDRIDLHGFSIGGFVAQEIALARPGLLRRLVLAATGPKGAPGMHGWRDNIAAARGDNDLMIPTKLSRLMAGLIPDARIRVYPDAARGVLFQYPAEVAADVNAFLASEEGRARS
jgi:pimeloyl-ACP methyl ester carboxylesterase